MDVLEPDAYFAFLFFLQHCYHVLYLSLWGSTHCICYDWYRFSNSRFSRSCSQFLYLSLYQASIMFVWYLTGGLDRKWRFPSRSNIWSYLRSIRHTQVWLISVMPFSVLLSAEAVMVSNLTRCWTLWNTSESMVRWHNVFVQLYIVTGCETSIGQKEMRRVTRFSSPHRQWVVMNDFMSIQLPLFVVISKLIPVLAEERNCIGWAKKQ